MGACFVARMLACVFAVLSLSPALAAETITQNAGVVIPLWDKGAPGFEALRDVPEKSGDWWVRGVNNPSLTVFRPDPAHNSGTAIIVLPGGGHENLVFNSEGVKPSRFLQAQGVTAFALKYRLGRESDNPKADYDIAIHGAADLRRAVRFVRAHAAEYGIERIGVMAFSAGGELVHMTAFAGFDGEATAADPVDRLSARPDFIIEVYPGPLGVPERFETAPPPAFFLTAHDDHGPVAVLDRLSRLYAQWPDVPIETHILAAGGHAFNMGERSTLRSVKDWPSRLSDWLIDRGYLSVP